MQERKKGNAQGVDVAHYQGNIDFKKVTADGITFVIAKATQNGMDKKFIQNIVGARAAGLLTGAYHYLDNSVTTVSEAKEAAAKFAAAIRKAGGVDLPPVLDYESKASSLSAASATLIARAFLEEIERLTGQRGMLYTYPAFIHNFRGLESWPLWIARYSASKVPANASGWTQWEIWQYHGGVAGEGGTLPNGKQRVAGIASPVDLNEWNGTPAQMRARYGPAAAQPKPPAVEPAPAAPAAEIPEEVDILHNGVQLKSPEAPGLDFGGVVYAQLAHMADIFGVSHEWDNAKKKAYFNGREIQTARAYGGRVYIPVRAIAEAYGAKVIWDGKGPSVDIRGGVKR